MHELVPIHVASRIISDYATHTQANLYQAMTFDRSDAKLIQRKEESLKKDKDGDGDSDDDDDDEEEEEVADEDPVHQQRFMMQQKDYTMDDNQALLCPARVRGFSLADKKWAFFLVDCAKDIVWLENPMDRLEIDDGSKKVISALVKSHEKRQTRVNAQFQDLIPRKGLGLAMLFAGAPGLGKTLTAEIVSEHRKKALYAITSGELGTDTVEADNRMRKIFDRAKAWDAYLLLDEADVFLAERSRDDLARNGLATGE
jgi:SpoVK/Ycf46/Vps4 family AAA+-type ATPase